MTGTFLHVSDVADEIVQSYLHRLTRRIGNEHIKEVWFRVVSGSFVLPLDSRTTVIDTPIFEVLISVSEPMSGLSSALAGAATEMRGKLRVMPDAVMDGDLTSADLESGGWCQTDVPRVVSPVPAQEALALS